MLQSSGKVRLAMDCMKKKIAIIGASYLQKPLVEKANQMGLETLCFAWEDGAVCKDFCARFFPVSVLDKEKVCEICATEGVAGVVSIASDIVVPTVAYVAQELGLVGNSMNSAYCSTNKGMMRKALSAGGVRCPLFWILSDSDDVDELADKVGFPVIVKPSDRSGSRGVTKVMSREALKSAITVAVECSFCKQTVVEPFVQGREVSVEYISWKGRHYFLAVTDKETSGAPFYVELAHHQPTSFPADICTEIRRQTELGLDALRVEYGASHSEFIITDKGEIYATEIGARMGGDFIGARLVELSTGYDFLKGVVDVALGEFCPPVFGEEHCSGVYFLSRETPYIRKYIENHSKTSQIVEAEILGERSPVLKSSADRNGYFIYQNSQRFQAKDERRGS